MPGPCPGHPGRWAQEPVALDCRVMPGNEGREHSEAKLARGKDERSGSAKWHDRFGHGRKTTTSIRSPAGGGLQPPPERFFRWRYALGSGLNKDVNASGKCAKCQRFLSAGTTCRYCQGQKGADMQRMCRPQGLPGQWRDLAQGFVSMLFSLPDPAIGLADWRQGFVEASPQHQWLETFGKGLKTPFSNRERTGG